MKRRKENILERFFKRRKENEPIVKKNKITIFYNPALQEITGVPFEEALVPDGFTFADALHSLFVSYPEIPKKIPPGKLGFLLNGRAPETFDIVKNGDRVEFMVFKEQIQYTQEQLRIIRNQIENEILGLIKRYQVDLSLEKIKETIFNEKSFRDLYPIIDVFSEKIEDLEKTNEVLNILNKAWNYFPHKSLNGLCPIEKIMVEWEKNNPYRKLDKK